MTPARAKRTATGPAAIVLAGGASSRFGSDKLVMALADGRPVLAHTVEALAAVADPIIVVLAPGAAEPDLGRPVVIARDPASFGGPLVGLGAGLSALRDSAPEAEIALIAGGDMPSLVPGVLDLLVAVLVADSMLATVTLEADPPSILPMALRVSQALAAVEAILGGGGKRSMRALLAAAPSVLVPAATWRALDPAAATLRDIDTPADLG